MPKQSKVPLRVLLDQLDELLAWFNQDDFDIEEGLAKFQIGTELVEVINTRLGVIEGNITVLKEKFDKE